MEKQCAICGATENLTTDHIIPKWLYKRLHYFDGVNTIKVRKNLGAKNKQVLCGKHNGEKGGKIQFDHPLTKEVIFPIIEGLYKEMLKHVDK